MAYVSALSFFNFFFSVWILISPATSLNSFLKRDLCEIKRLIAPTLPTDSKPAVILLQKCFFSSALCLRIAFTVYQVRANVTINYLILAAVVLCT